MGKPVAIVKVETDPLFLQFCNKVSELERRLEKAEAAVRFVAGTVRHIVNERAAASEEKRPKRESQGVNRSKQAVRFRLGPAKPGYPGHHIEDATNPDLCIYIPQGAGSAELCRFVLSALNEPEVQA